MPRVRLLSAVAVLSLVLLVVAGHGQTIAAPLVILENVGLPAVEEGVIGVRTTDVTRIGSSGRRYIPGRLIVKFRDGTTTAARLSALSVLSRTSRSAAIQTRPDYADFDLVRIDPSEDAEAMADALRRQSNVEYAQPAYRVRAEFVPNDRLYSQLQWNLPLIDMERAWDIQPEAGSTVTVAVLDTGVAFMNATVTATASTFVDDRGVRYPALGRLTLPYAAAPQLGASSRFVAPRDFIGNMTPLDFDGHGTHVSGTIGQLTAFPNGFGNDNNADTGTAGIAFNVKLMPVKVLASQWDVIFGSSPEVGGSDDDVARGLRYAADNGAKVINMSLGSSGPATCGTNPNLPGCAPVVEDAVRYAVGRGAFVVVAGGNDFTDGNPAQVIADIASRVSGAVAVASVDSSKNRAFYSSTGSYIELAAPGGGAVGSNRDGYVWQQTFDFNFTDTFLKPPSGYGPPRFDVLAYVGYAGTSQAAPHVSGVAAMLVQQGVTDPAAIEAALEKFATDLGTPGRDTSFGFGLVEARNTLRGLGLAK